MTSIQKTTISSWLIIKKYVLYFLGSLSFKDIWTMIKLFPIHFLDRDFFICEFPG